MNWNNYIITWQKKIKEEEIELEKLRKKAYKIAKRCSNILVNEYKVKRVILIGSVIKKVYFHKLSDIDLVVEGLKDNEYIKALVRLSKISDGFDIQIIPFEDAYEWLRDRALKEGKILYEEK